MLTGAAPEIQHPDGSKDSTTDRLSAQCVLTALIAVVSTPSKIACGCGGELDLTQFATDDPTKLVGVCVDCARPYYLVEIAEGAIFTLPLPTPDQALVTV